MWPSIAIGVVYAIVVVAAICWLENRREDHEMSSKDHGYSSYEPRRSDGSFIGDYRDL